MEVWSCTLAEVALNDAFYWWSSGNLGVHDVVHSQPFSEVEKQFEKHKQAKAAEHLEQAWPFEVRQQVQHFVQAYAEP